MKTLNEQIEEIKNAKTSRTAKRLIIAVCGKFYIDGLTTMGAAQHRH